MWDLVDMSDATVGTNVVLLDGFLTGVEINNFMEGMNSAMEDIMDGAGVTEGMNQTEIFNAENFSGFNAEGYGEAVFYGRNGLERPNQSQRDGKFADGLWLR